MSVYDIQNKDEKDAKIEGYMDERLPGLQQVEDRKEMFKPVLESNVEMTKRYY